MPHALLFDIDGTLIETFDTILVAMNAALEEAGMGPLGAEELRPLIGRDIASQMAALRGTSGPLVDTIRDTYYENFVARMADTVTLYPGVAETLEALCGLPMSTITTRRRRVARQMLQVVGIADHFTTIVGGDEVSEPKPHPELVHRACASLDLHPRKAVAVGDSPVDILAGRAAGTRTVAAAYGYGDAEELAEAGPDATLRRFADLPEALARLGV